MRLHRLSVTAFGPFAGTEQIDFDELNHAGLFLLTGPTGAGKSSLLDAVCFALYGTVPGVRGVKALKSQHAPAHVTPEVVLDVTVQGRRFVVRRSPEWARPKKRGDGLLVEKASASIVETTGGDEHFLSSRAAEVGHLVTSLMGMNAAQFAQVALLPQGEFQTFLRASSQERHDVLQHLFRTDRFARIEDWVHDRSRRLKERSGDGQSVVRRLVDTVADRAGVSTPSELVGDDLARASAEGRVLPWVAEVLAGAQADAATAESRHRQVTEQVDEARRLHAGAQHRAERRQRRESARRSLRTLDESAAAAGDARAALHTHERAVQCAPLTALSSQAARELEEAAGLRDVAVEALGALRHQDCSDAVLTELADDARRRVAELDALLPREQAAHAALRERDAAEQRLLAAEREERETADRAEQLPDVIDHLATEVATVGGRAARADVLRVALDAASRRRDAGSGLGKTHEALLCAKDVHRDARDRMQDARDRVQTLAAQRLAGIAAELAATLVDGVACEVCGSVDHPLPATAVDHPVTSDDQSSAEETLAARVADLEAADARARTLQSREDVLAAAAEGISADAAGAEVARLARELDDSLAARQELPTLEERLTARRLDLESLGRRQAAAAAGATALGQAVAAHARALVSLEAEIGRVLGATTGDGTVEQGSRDLADQLARLTTAQSAVRHHCEVARRAGTLTEQADASALQQGFNGLAEVQRALLSEPERAGLAALLRERDDAEARARAVLEDPDHAQDADEPDGSPGAGNHEANDDVGALALALSETEGVAAQTTRARAVAEHRLEALGSTRERLAVAIRDWGPVRDESLRAESMARLVRGMGHDNQLQMRLSAYVLATRLDQVVAAANERLGQMRDQRYLLQRTGRAERRTAQAGLGLEVVDQWTGDVRAPTTLSGGETFVVSLALALGLADVVTHEAGGTEIETLFVDEGFGTLDADTLDDVMDRLDGLRAGGRTVGVVSHVSELRSRIPTQVLVEKGRAGSSVTVRTLVG